eukprot:CAMPEP_0183465884 /NCGR_PEP_ID=MMETSP0370-20130417/147996_1 /TAXON_ID=268820 /ORGANISM="Peridinium aciculiferum, Strain PAER-2" /LENGTH=103 /DNA_ID=CAMNT_0025658121 /DNA_START=17 /DNA_END=325 /DNA_ORIENTATION=+
MVSHWSEATEPAVLQDLNRSLVSNWSEATLPPMQRDTSHFSFAPDHAAPLPPTRPTAGSSGMVTLAGRPFAQKGGVSLVSRANGSSIESHAAPSAGVLAMASL